MKMKDIAVVLQTPDSLPALLWGDTGCGKSRRIEQLADKLGWRCITVIASSRLPEDFGGCLIPDNGNRPQRVPDDFVWEAREAAEKGENVLLFFDEVSCSPPAVQSALLTAILDLRFGSVMLPKDKVRVVAAANPADVAAGGFELADSLAARFTHVQDDSPVDEFVKWLLTGDGANIEAPTLDVDRWAVEFKKARVLLAAYMRRFPDHQQESIEQRAGREPKRFACRRTWTNAIRLYAAAMTLGDDNQAIELVENSVGPLGVQFCAWAQEQDVPSPEEMIAQPAIFSHDRARPDRTFVALSSLAQYVTEDTNLKKLWPKAWAVMSRAIDTGASADEITPAVMTLVQKRPQGGLTDKSCLPHVKRVAELVKDVQALAEGLKK